MGPAGRPRDLALALIISRVVAPAFKPSTAGLVGRHHTEPDLGVAGASTDDVYAAMDWLAAAGRDRGRAGRLAPAPPRCSPSRPAPSEKASTSSASRSR